jgi:Raf kinase inhibitor-like YbhB/YbcL family protein
MHANYARFLTFLLCKVSVLSAPAYAGSPPRIVLQSTVFADSAAIPAPYTCAGLDHSPPLRWSVVPARATTLAIIVKDPDAPGGTFVHWVLYNLPATVSELPANLLKTPTLPQGADQGVTGFDRTGYWGPCPPPGPPHHYHFVIYALDAKLHLKPGAGANEVERAATGHILGKGELIGTFGRDGDPKLER